VLLVQPSAEPQVTVITPQQPQQPMELQPMQPMQPPNDQSTSYQPIMTTSWCCYHLQQQFGK